MSLAAMIRAMAALGKTADEIADVVTRMDEERLEKARAGNARRQAAYRKRHRDAVDEQNDNGGNGVTGVTPVTTVTPKERPHTPKENPPTSFGPLKGSSVGTPRGGPPPAKSTRLAPDWWPSDAGIEFARTHGFDDAAIRLEVEKIRNWSASSPKGACRDWDARWRNWILQAGPPSRAGPVPPRRGRTVAEMAQMNLDDFPDERADQRDEPPERPSGADQGRSGFAGRLSVEDAATARRGALVDH